MQARPDWLPTAATVEIYHEGLTLLDPLTTKIGEFACRSTAS
jgi:hypothetical protein